MEKEKLETKEKLVEGYIYCSFFCIKSVNIV